MNSSNNTKEISFGFYDREALRHLVRKVIHPKACMLEVGSWLGEGSTQIFIDELRAVDGELYSVDTWEGSSNVQHHLKFTKDNDPYLLFIQNIEKANALDIVHPRKMTSLQAAEQFDDGVFDLVFIDGNHSNKTTKQDISAWLPKVRPGGILCGHDCEGRVTESNREFLESNCDDDMDCITPQGDRSYFRVIHPGVILAVDDAFDGKAHLWAEDLVMFSNGGVGPATLWDLQIPIEGQFENKGDTGKANNLDPIFHVDQDHTLSLQELHFLDNKIVKFQGLYFGIPLNRENTDLSELSAEELSSFNSASSFEELKTQLIREETLFFGHNIVRYQGRYFGLPVGIKTIALGEFSSEERSKLPNADSFDVLRQILIGNFVRANIISRLRNLLPWGK